jgi:hypothetical protein
MERKLIKNCKYNLKYDYYIQDDGYVYSGVTNKILSTQLDKDGYVKVRMVDSEGNRHRFSMHRLVMENFKPVEGMENLQVNHIDGNKQNNDISNLEWVTCEENIHHAMRTNLRANQRGRNNGASKLTEEDVLEIIDLLLSKNYTQRQIGNRFGVGADCIGAIKNKRNWAYLTKDIDFN